MAQPWLLLLLPLGCPALPTEITSLLRLAQLGVGAPPLPPPAPPRALQVSGAPRTLVICLVLDAAPPGRHSPIWFSTGNGSALDAFTYGPAPAADGTWSSWARLSLSSEELAAWEPLACHAGALRTLPRPLPGHTPILKNSHSSPWLAGEASPARTCFQDDLRGTQSHALHLGAVRLLLCKLLLTDVLLTCHILLLPRRPHSCPAKTTHLPWPQGPKDPAP
ncbi:pre T-cell antigen receptor alpha [Perognathus longimembris pacificus]|uniref:pre T-cell antigen receptor alpha n=1 Tax=Perognathus longimembris pacificus TaxID=214514 RepID=UPI002018D486|nr:pre T-cell antigen receptor alpha [Perognathus longimembris pacificus]